jgi:hypothetical protein
MSHHRLHGIFTLRSPLSHIGETISTQTYLVQEPVIQPDGSIEEVFAYNGNAWRGALRDAAAAYMLDRLAAEDSPHARVPIDIFHLLFTGGRIGGEQQVDIEQARRFRSAVPMISLWGGGIGNQILAGKLRVSNSYPVCAEAAPVLPAALHKQALKLPYASITFEKSFSRMDDARREDLRRYLPSTAPSDELQRSSDVADQMRMTTELVAAGVQLYTEIDILDASNVELGALVSALTYWSRSPHLGGQANKGHGKAWLDYRVTDLQSGQTQPFFSINDATAPLVSVSAQSARDDYDAHLLALYDQMLATQAPDLRALLGGV